jgi:hypothetical protein
MYSTGTESLYKTGSIANWNSVYKDTVAKRTVSAREVMQKKQKEYENTKKG